MTEQTDPSETTAAPPAIATTPSSSSSTSSSFHSIQSAHTSSPSALRSTLTLARTNLYTGNPPFLFSFLFNPLRDFVFDPTLALWSVLLPPLLVNSPYLDWILSKFLNVLILIPIRMIYCWNDTNNNKEGVSLLSQSNEAVKQMRNFNQCGNSMPRYSPPSDVRSAILGGISFVISAVGDVIGVLTNPKKRMKWADAFCQMKAYLNATGIGDELEEGIMKPLLRGRLFDNLKMLNDVQEQVDVDRHIKASKSNLFHGIQDTDNDRILPNKHYIQDGHRFMRWATAAYGTEMIKSAVDTDVSAHELSTLPQAIALHCHIDIQDVRYIYSKDDGDKHILHHFVAVDRVSKSVVLALRGTLSLSGAIIDVRGMAENFCFCLAHQGMAEMASDVWDVAGEHVNALFQEEELKDYGFIITGHSLGAGVSCLLNIKCHVEQLVGKDRRVQCFGFAPPPTFYPCRADATGDGNPDPPALVTEAINNCVAYIHDNDAVPFLSVSSVRRLASLLDAVDNVSEHMWFYDRWKIYHEVKPVPKEIFDSVAEATARENEEVDGECRMIIPAKSVIWMKQNVLSKKFEAYDCDASAVAKNTVFMSQDMFSDHLPEMYEDALDALLEQLGSEFD